MGKGFIVPPPVYSRPQQFQATAASSEAAEVLLGPTSTSWNLIGCFGRHFQEFLFIYIQELYLFTNVTGIFLLMAIIPVFQAEIFPHFHDAIMQHNGANAFLSVPWLDHQTRVDSSLHYFFSVRSFLSRSHMVVSFMQPRKSFFHLAGIDFATSLVGCTFKHFMSQFLAPCLSDKSDKWKYTFPADIPQEVLTKDPNRQLWSHLLRSVPTCWGGGGSLGVPPQRPLTPLSETETPLDMWSFFVFIFSP